MPDSPLGTMHFDNDLKAEDLGPPGRDPLTGLPDRRIFARRLERGLSMSDKGEARRLAVCFIDLDGFKSINDRFGHLAGDRVLCEIARRLLDCLGPRDAAGRFGGDEFTLLLDGVNQRSEAERRARRVLDHLRRPMTVEDNTMRIAASVGVALGGGEVGRAEDLLREADAAMYGVKATGGNDVGFFGGGRRR